MNRLQGSGRSAFLLRAGEALRDFFGGHLGATLAVLALLLGLVALLAVAS
jgi:hypothetical protein